MCPPVGGGLSLASGDLPACGGHTKSLSLQVEKESLVLYNVAVAGS